MSTVVLLNDEIMNILILLVFFSVNNVLFSEKENWKQFLKI